ncbi:MAG: phosphoserine phosphatase SerB [Rhizobiales bacterium]|nr:phosphoserine phosphatase SerB [Hyphomicrobiales bacterium]
MDSVAVLIAAPGSGAIGSDIMAMLREFGAGPLRWLAEVEAVEVEAFERLGEFRVAIAGLPIDLAVVPKANRRKRLLIADMDSTMIGQECIDELGVMAGAGEAIKAITCRTMRGELDFAEALRQRVGLMRGLEEGAIGTILRDRITYASGGATLVATMKANRAHTALVSGGFRQFTTAVADHLGFDSHQANDLIIENGRLAGAVHEPVLGQEAKVAILKSLTRELSISENDALAVGDGANDIPMLLAAGMGVALHAKPKVREQARIAIDHGDLTALLYLQGYTKAQFINA